MHDQMIGVGCIMNAAAAAAADDSVEEALGTDDDDDTKTLVLGPPKTTQNPTTTPTPDTTVALVMGPTPTPTTTPTTTAASLVYRRRGRMPTPTTTPMKAMKAMKPMRAMKAKRVSKRMAKVVAFRGHATGGATTLKKADLIKNKQGRIVSKKQSMLAKVRYAKGIGKWTAAFMKARKALRVKGFVALKKGTPLYDKAKQLYGPPPASPGWLPFET